MNSRSNYTLGRWGAPSVEMGESRTPRPRLLIVPRLRAWSALFISLDLPRTDALQIPPGRLS